MKFFNVFCITYEIKLFLVKKKSKNEKLSILAVNFYKCVSYSLFESFFFSNEDSAKLVKSIDIFKIFN